MSSVARSLLNVWPAHRRRLAAFSVTLVTIAALTALASPPDHSGGAISGTVMISGTAPKMTPVNMAKEPTCASQHNPPQMTDNVITGAGGTLADVVVYISSGDAAAAPPPTAVVRLDQKGCWYLPHVAVLQTGQPLEIVNSDQTSHNIHPLSNVNPEWNKLQPPGAAPIRVAYESAEFIPVKCNVHPWMHGFFAVLRTAHSQMTGTDGAFDLKGIPPGKYTLTAWHERFGAQSQEVTITGNETASVKFVYKVAAR